MRRTHRARDTTMEEGAGQRCTGNPSRALVAPRKGPLGVLRDGDWANIPDTTGHYGATARKASTPPRGYPHDAEAG